MIRFVTTNDGKFREVSGLLRLHEIDIGRLDRGYPERQADTLEEVVDSAVRALAAEVEGDFFLDDSGLFIDALAGFPGVYAAYAHRTIGVPGILRLLEGRGDRAARFETVIGARIEGSVHTFRGECRGTVAPRPRGSGGFGFDPIFVPEGREETFAEMTTTEKNLVSHRGQAVRALVAFLLGRES